MKSKTKLQEASDLINILIIELDCAISEINAMRDIHYTDGITPADHWDKETLHSAQMKLKEITK